MALNKLQPRIQTLKTTSLVNVLDTKAGATERIRGRAWMTIRRAVLLRDAYTCQCCGIVRLDNEVDHIIPLEQGGPAMDINNMQTLCGGPDGCHTRKTAEEARSRQGGIRSLGL